MPITPTIAPGIAGQRTSTATAEQAASKADDQRNHADHAAGPSDGF
jgi:hypothetical protein